MNAPAILPHDTPPNEAFSVLQALAQRHTAPIPPDLLARHVLTLAADAGWPVQRAAMEAILRRVAAARQDRLSIARAPQGRRGHYTTRRKDARERPYVTVVERIDPLRASCDCRELGLVDDHFGDDLASFRRELEARARAIAADPDLAVRLAEKRDRRERDEARKPLEAYRAEELERMRLNFYGFDPSYHAARYDFVHDVPKSRTALHLAAHRRKPRPQGLREESR